MELGTNALTVELDTPVESDLGGKYLTFRLGEEEYGVEILNVKEILGVLPITAVPRTPESIRGVVNLRGKIIPVLDLRRKFGMAPAPDTEFTCIIVVEADVRGAAALMGIIVDTVSEVVDIVDQEIEETPCFGAEVDTGYILGMAKHASTVIILLNVEAVLSENDVIELATLAPEELARAAAGNDEEA